MPARIYDSTTYPQRDPATLDATPWARREPPVDNTTNNTPTTKVILLNVWNI